MGGNRIPLLLITFFLLTLLFIFFFIITTPGVASLRPLVFEGKGTHPPPPPPRHKKEGRRLAYSSQWVYIRGAHVRCTSYTIL